MKKLKYRLSKKAVEDLENIWEYTFDNWSVAQADRYYTLIIDEIEFISKNSYSGKSMEHVKPGYRATIVKSHVIFFRIDNHGHVEIIRILHQMMDSDDILND